MRKKIKKSGFTLVEVLIASAIFAIVLSGSILMSNKSRVLAQKNLVKELVICAAQSRLNQVLAMPYEEPGLDIKVINDYDSAHNPSYDGKFQIRLDSTNVTLTPEQVGGQHIYSNNANRYKQKSGPFPLWDYNNNTWHAGVGPMKADHYLGREENDCNLHDANRFKLTAAEISRMTVDNTTDDSADTTFSFGANKTQNNLYAYALCDDVDDFDGMSYVIYNVFSDVDLLVEVAVRPHYRRDITNLVATGSENGVLEDNEVAPNTGTVPPQSYNSVFPPVWGNVTSFGDMGGISADANMGAGMAGRGNSEAALDYYRDCIYKEVVVTVTWKFGENGVYQTFSMYGMKSVPQDDDHQVILEKTMNFVYDVTTL